MENKYIPKIAVVVKGWVKQIEPDCSCDDILEMMSDDRCFIMLKSDDGYKYLIPKSEIKIIYGAKTNPRE